MNAELLYVSISIIVLIVFDLNFFRGKNKPQPTTPVTEDSFWAKTRNNPHYVPPSRGAPVSASPPSTTASFNTGPLSGTRPQMNTSVSTKKGDSSFWAKTRNNPHCVPPTATVSIPSTTTRYNIGSLSGTRPQTNTSGSTNKGDSSFWAKTRNNLNYVVPTSARYQATPSVTINMANLSASSGATSGASQVTPSVPSIASTSSSSPQIFVTNAPFLPAPPPSANTQSSPVPALQDIQFSSHPKPTIVTTMQDEPISETRT